MFVLGFVSLTRNTFSISVLALQVLLYLVVMLVVVRSADRRHSVTVHNHVQHPVSINYRGIEHATDS